ncbi:DUF421 domain-containing protein [Pseudalkalibacillus hwajinpoensis]|uniref:DUF421 domain-containing protein n=1 Tax=Guptibacillus hwajinpoensis TaxID=208199 RepID=UPI00325C0A91
MDITEVLVRITITFIVLFILARVMGRKEISQMTYFNWVSAVAIGSLAANIAFNKNITLSIGIIALVGWTIFTLILGMIDIKFKSARKVTTGEPIIVIREGKIMEHALRKTRLDIDALRSLIREKNVFQLSDVNYAIFETNGKISVMKKDPVQTVTKHDMNTLISPKPFPIPTEVVSEGIVNMKNLKMLNRDKEWLDQQLAQEGVQDVSSVLYAEIQQDGTLYVDQKKDSSM